MYREHLFEAFQYVDFNQVDEPSEADPTFQSRSVKSISTYKSDRIGDFIMHQTRAIINETPLAATSHRSGIRN